MKDNEITKALGLKLRAHFEKENITQKDLAEEFNTKQSWISRIYQGNFGVRSRVARELCNKANIDFLDKPELAELLQKHQLINEVSQKLFSISKNDVEILKKISLLLEDLTH